MGNRQTEGKPKGHDAGDEERKPLVERKAPVERKAAGPVFYDIRTHPDQDLLLMALHIRSMKQVAALVAPENRDKLEVHSAPLLPFSCWFAQAASSHTIRAAEVAEGARARPRPVGRAAHSSAVGGALL